jgi:hypothetical protein
VAGVNTAGGLSPTARLSRRGNEHGSSHLLNRSLAHARYLSHIFISHKQEPLGRIDVVRGQRLDYATIKATLSETHRVAALAQCVL